MTVSLSFALKRSYLKLRLLYNHLELCIPADQDLACSHPIHFTQVSKQYWKVTAFSSSSVYLQRWQSLSPGVSPKPWEAFLRHFS